MFQNDKAARPWVRYSDSKPSNGEAVEILVEIDSIESRALRAVCAQDAATKAICWVDPASGEPLSGFRRVTHWRRVPKI